MKVDTAAVADRERGTSFKQVIKEQLGDLKGFEVLGSQVLVASYIQPRKTAGGIIIPDSAIDEDRWQGKVNLVLKMGPAAFKYEGWGQPYEGPKPSPGDYVMFNTSDGRELAINGVSCRLVDSQLIKMISPDPDNKSVGRVY